MTTNTPSSTYGAPSIGAAHSAKLTDADKLREIEQARLDLERLILASTGIHATVSVDIFQSYEPSAQQLCAAAEALGWTLQRSSMGGLFRANPSGLSNTVVYSSAHFPQEPTE